MQHTSLPVHLYKRSRAGSRESGRRFSRIQPFHDRMAGPETTPPHASPTRFEPTTPERVRQVELNRLRGTVVSFVPSFLP